VNIILKLFTMHYSD